VGIGPVALNLYLDLAECGVLMPGQSILELGSQDLVPEDFDLETVFSMFGRTPQSGLSTGRDFMTALGFMYYICVDIDGRAGTTSVDLNTATCLDECFDVVTNHGTTEHIFNQENCFRFIHDAAKVGGVMIHVVPTHGVISHGQEVGYGNHGLYLYATDFFRDLSFANNYEVLRNYSVEDSAGALLVHVARRQSSADFVIPQQAMYR